MPENGTQELEVSHGQSKFKIRGSDWLSMVGIGAGVLLVYLVLEHKADVHASSKELSQVMKEMTAAQIKGVEAQRELNCLISLPQERRENSIEFCRRIAR